jgi:hypothetical protein
VKALIFVAASFAYAVVAYIVYTGLILQCGLGSDSPTACNAAADRQSFSFAVGAIVFYAVLSAGYWWRRGHSKS